MPLQLKRLNWHIQDFSLYDYKFFFMAVEIRELVIKAIITKSTKTKKKDVLQTSGLADNERVIQECVSQVMKIIKQNQNR